MGEQFIMMPVPANMFTAVCALIGAGGAVAGMPSIQPRGSSSAQAARQAVEVEQGAGVTVAAKEVPAEASSGEIDAHGHPWSEAMHASTRTKTQDGLWRMKVGVKRPDALPGFPKGDTTGTATSGAASQASATAQIADAEDEDEFAAFRAATEAAKPKDVPARKWTDADLSALCNQAAVKLGEATQIKELIQEFVGPDGIAHSRNIPAGEREAFAQALENVAGIKFAG